jgi:hypothetical protein
LQLLQEGRDASLFFRIVCGPVQEHADATHPIGLLRVRGARPGDCRAAKKGDEFAPPYGLSLIENHTLSRRQMNEAFCILHHSKFGR